MGIANTLRLWLELSRTVDIKVSSNAREVGECIYCGTREAELGTEHAVPYGLNGPLTLLKASCNACAKITHRFERDVMRCLWPDVRNVLAMQSRRKDKRSPTVRLIVHRNGTEEVIQIPRTEYPTYLPTPLFPPPGILWCNKPIRGVFTNADTIHLAGPTFEEASKQYPGADFVGSRANFSPEYFARTLAKIGFCAAVASIGLGAFSKTPIRNIILGSDPHIGYLVGSWYGEQVNGTDGGLHEIRVKYSASDSQIHAFIKLFAQFGAPEYHVMLGPADPTFVASSDWPPIWS